MANRKFQSLDVEQTTLLLCGQYGQLLS